MGKKIQVWILSQLLTSITERIPQCLSIAVMLLSATEKEYVTSVVQQAHQCLRKHLGRLYFTREQLQKVISCFPEAPFHARIRAMVLIFSKVWSISDFWEAVKTLLPVERARQDVSVSITHVCPLHRCLSSFLNPTAGESIRIPQHHERRWCWSDILTGPGTTRWTAGRATTSLHRGTGTRWVSFNWCLTGHSLRWTTMLPKLRRKLPRPKF